MIPAIVKSYDPVKRTCRIEIKGLTDGSQTLPEAIIAYPIGDKSDHTEILIAEGDKVWVTFINDDTRYPVITHYRAKEAGNANGVRKFHHAAFEFDALTGDVVIRAAGTVRLEAPNIEIIGNTAITGTLTNNGINVSSTHTHPQNNGNHFGGGANTGSPQ
jgi:hypothetical protein